MLILRDLPGIALAENETVKSDLLKTYASSSSYLEEEIRYESAIKDWGKFLRFLRFSAGESGHIVNLSAISREFGVKTAQVKNYYLLLEDIFIGFLVSAFSGSRRKSALSSPRFFFLDNVIRNATAGLPLTINTGNAYQG